MKIRLLLFFLGAPLALWSQNVVVSDELNMRTDINYELIGELKGRVLLFEDQDNQFEVQAFDENMRSSWRKELELAKRNPEVLGINTVGDYFTVFYRHRSKGNTIIRADRFDPAANPVDTNTVYDFGGIFFTPNYEVVRSEDRTKVMIFYVENFQHIHAVVFDNTTMKTLWYNSFEPENFTFGEDVLHMVVNNRGEMFAILEKDNYDSRKDKHHYEIYQYGPEATGFARYRIPMTDKQTFDMMVAFDNQNGYLSAGGLFYDRNPMRAEGYFFIKIDVQKQQHELNFWEFQDEFQESLTGRKTRKRSRGIEEISIQDLVLRQDGGIVILGEESRNFNRRMPNSRLMMMDNFGRTNTDFYYNDIFAISVNPDGSRHWEKVLHKKQFSTDDGGIYSSFFLFKNPRNLRLIFNDEIKYENTVSEYVIFGGGNFNRRSILSTQNLKLRLRFREALQISPSKLLVPSERRSRLRIAKVELE